MREAAGNWTDYREIVAGIRELVVIAMTFTSNTKKQYNDIHKTSSHFYWSNSYHFYRTTAASNLVE